MKYADGRLLTKDEQEELVKLVRGGVDFLNACKHMRVAKASLYFTRNNDPEFAAKFNEAHEIWKMGAATEMERHMLKDLNDGSVEEKTEVWTLNKEGHLVLTERKIVHRRTSQKERLSTLRSLEGTCWNTEKKNEQAEIPEAVQDLKKAIIEKLTEKKEA